jgi:hypothetical protein
VKLIQCPDIHSHTEDWSKTIFLGGSITGAEPWQDKMVEMLWRTNLKIINPRRNEFDVSNKRLTKEQILWEFGHLRNSSAYIFWFSWETVAPITLYELGVRIGQAACWQDIYGVYKPIFVGVHPDYPRRLDIEEQLMLVRISDKVKIDIVYTLDELAEKVIEWSLV